MGLPARTSRRALRRELRVMAPRGRGAGPGLQRPEVAEFRAGAPTPRGPGGHFAGGQTGRAGEPEPELGKCGAVERGGRRQRRAGRGGGGALPHLQAKFRRSRSAEVGEDRRWGTRLGWASARLGAAEGLGLPCWKGGLWGRPGTGGRGASPPIPSLGPSPRHTCPGLFRRLSPPAPQRRVICGWRAQRLPNAR